jgi:hypothetical protein
MSLHAGWFIARDGKEPSGMADGGTALGAQRTKALALLSEFAAGRAGEIARIETAGRLLLAARRLIGDGQLPQALLGHPLAEAARAWDPAVLTAGEFAEHLATAELDALLESAQGWAAEAVSALAPLGRRAA